MLMPPESTTMPPAEWQLFLPKALSACRAPTVASTCTLRSTGFRMPAEYGPSNLLNCKRPCASPSSMLRPPDAPLRSPGPVGASRTASPQRLQMHSSPRPSAYRREMSTMIRVPAGRSVLTAQRSVRPRTHTSRSKMSHLIIGMRNGLDLSRPAPHPYRAVLSRGNGEAAVFGEGDGPDLVAVAFEGADFFASGEI